jgi:REP element-mobilizing transposase RayT
MPRIARIVEAGYPHHIVQTGNNKENVFLDRTDYDKYLFSSQSIRKRKRLPFLPIA